MDYLIDLLSREIGLNGEPRPTGPKENARTTVQKRIATVIDKLKEFLPTCGEFIEGHIETGKYCRYNPPTGDNKIDWAVKK